MAAPPYNTPDYSGLQVSDCASQQHYGGLELASPGSPEMLMKYPDTGATGHERKGSGMQVVNQAYPEVYSPGYPEVAHGEHFRPTHEVSPSSIKKKGFSRRCWIVSGAIALVIIAVVVGCVVGLVVARSSQSYVLDRVPNQPSRLAVVNLKLPGERKTNRVLI